MSTHNSRGLTATGPPAMPMWLTLIRGAIIIFSLGVLIAAAYNLSLFNIPGYSGPAGFLVFDVIFTWLIVGFMLAAEFFAHNLFIRIVFVVALALDAIFWLSGWAWAASLASAYNGVYGDADAYGASMAAAAALGAFTWILILVLLGFFIKACLSSHDDTHSDAQTAELGQVRHEPKDQAVPIQQQPVYAQQQQQPVYAQPQGQQAYAQPQGQPVYAQPPPQ